MSVLTPLAPSLQCAECRAPVCDRQAVISRVLGGGEVARCLDCLGRTLGSTPEQLCQLVGRYLAQRECHRKAWLAARPCGREGQAPCCPSRLECSASPPDWFRAELFRAPEPELPEPDAVVDAEESGCGDLMVLLMRSIRRLPAEGVLQLIARDPGAAEDIPAWCRLTGHLLLAGRTGPDGATYYIRRKPA